MTGPKSEAEQLSEAVAADTKFSPQTKASYLRLAAAGLVKLPKELDRTMICALILQLQCHDHEFEIVN